MGEKKPDNLEKEPSRDDFSETIDLMMPEGRDPFAFESKEEKQDREAEDDETILKQAEDLRHLELISGEGELRGTSPPASEDGFATHDERDAGRNHGMVETLNRLNKKSLENRRGE